MSAPILLVRASTTNLTSPSRSSYATPAPTAESYCLPTVSSWPAFLACASLRPTLATCGWVNLAETTLVDRMGVHADGALDRDHGFRAGLVGERLAADQVGEAKRWDWWSARSRRP
jgi:hypothetical protein